MTTYPQWLRGEQRYLPRLDRDAFIDKSIESLVRVISRITFQGRRVEKQSPIGTRVKLASLLLFVLLVSLSRATAFVMLSATLVLVLLAFRRGEVILGVLKVSLVATGFTSMILLPSALWGNTPGAIRIIVKVFVCTSAARLLSITTEWSAMTGAMARMGLPDLFVLVLDVTVLYAWLLGRVSLELLHALKLRSVGRNRKKTSSLSGIAGVLFLRSREMAESLYAAMECRSFGGTYRRGRVRGRGIGAADVGALGVDALLVAAFVLLRS